MAWFLRERRGPSWKHGWTNQTLSSISLPPLPLLFIFAIVLLFLSLSQYMEYKAQVHQSINFFNLILFLCPVLLIFAVRSFAVNGRFVFRLPHCEPDSIHRGGGSPWGVGLVLLVLLVMVSYQSSFHGQWFRPLWRHG